MIEVNYNEYKETIAQNMKLVVENHDLKEKIERLNNIIKEVREYLPILRRSASYELDDKADELGMILDKEDI